MVMLMTHETDETMNEIMADEEDNRPSSKSNSNSYDHGNHHSQASSFVDVPVWEKIVKIHIENVYHP